jgi:hypothetical protein
MKTYTITEQQIQTLAAYMGEIPYKTVKEAMAIIHVVASRQEIKEIKDTPAPEDAKKKAVPDAKESAK